MSADPLHCQETTLWSIVAVCAAKKKRKLEKETSGFVSVMEPSLKRRRRDNWTTQETVSLVKLYRDRAPILRGKFSDVGCSPEAKAKAWEDIACLLKEQSHGFERSVKECQKRWQTVQSAAKAHWTAFNKAQQGTEFGPVPKALDTVDVLILEILGEENVTLQEVGGLPTGDTQTGRTVETAATVTTLPAAEAAAPPVGAETCSVLVDEGDRDHQQLLKKLQLEQLLLDIEMKKINMALLKEQTKYHTESNPVLQGGSTSTTIGGSRDDVKTGDLFSEDEDDANGHDECHSFSSVTGISSISQVGKENCRSQGKESNKEVDGVEKAIINLCNTKKRKIEELTRKEKDEDEVFFEPYMIRLKKLPKPIKGIVQLQIAQLFFNAENPHLPQQPITPLPQSIQSSDSVSNAGTH